jgi:hypothetical protein
MPDMAGVSVILPSKSTAILPHHGDTDPGYITGMEPAVLLALIQRKKEELGISYAKIERQAGARPGTIENLRKAVVNKTHAPKPETIAPLVRYVGGSGGGGEEQYWLAEEARCTQELAVIRAALEYLRKRK